MSNAGKREMGPKCGSLPRNAGELAGLHFIDEAATAPRNLMVRHARLKIYHVYWSCYCPRSLGTQTFQIPGRAYIMAVGGDTGRQKRLMALVLRTTFGSRRV